MLVNDILKIPVMDEPVPTGSVGGVASNSPSNPVGGSLLSNHLDTPSPNSANFNGAPPSVASARTPQAQSAAGPSAGGPPAGGVVGPSVPKNRPPMYAEEDARSQDAGPALLPELSVLDIESQLNEFEAEDLLSSVATPNSVPPQTGRQPGPSNAGAPEAMASPSPKPPIAQTPGDPQQQSKPSPKPADMFTGAQDSVPREQKRFPNSSAKAPQGGYHAHKAPAG